jgi:hypothetical protein
MNEKEKTSHKNLFKSVMFIYLNFIKNNRVGKMDEEKLERFKQDLILAQYYRASYDYRLLDQLMWQIPSVAITVSSVVFGISFGVIKDNYLIMGVVLILGGIINFSLLVAITKYRLAEDVRVNWMEYLEEKWGIEHIPMKTGDVIKFLEERGYTHRTFSWLRKQSSFTWLSYTLLILIISILSIGIYLILLYFLTY